MSSFGVFSKLTSKKSRLQSKSLCPEATTAWDQLSHLSSNDPK